MGRAHSLFIVDPAYPQVETFTESVEGLSQRAPQQTFIFWRPAGPAEENKRVKILERVGSCSWSSLLIEMLLKESFIT